MRSTRPFSILLLLVAMAGSMSIVQAIRSLWAARQGTEQLVRSQFRLDRMFTDLTGSMQDSRRRFLYLWTAKTNADLNAVFDQVHESDLQLTIVNGKLEGTLHAKAAAKALAAFDESWDRYVEVRDTIAQLASGQRTAEALILERTKGQLAYENALAQVGAVRNCVQRDAEALAARIQTCIQQAMLTLGASLGMMVVGLSLLTYVERIRRKTLIQLRRAQTEAEDHESWLRLAQDSAQIGTWEMDSTSGELRASPEWLRTFKMPTNTKITAYQWMETVHEDDRNRLWSISREYEREFSVEFRLQTSESNGGHRWFYTRGIILRATDGTPIREIGCTMEITERKRQEEALREAKRLADLASESKSAFLANMSHELRTPLHGMLAMTDLLITTELSAEQLEFTDTIQRSGQHLLKVINEILDLSRLESGKVTVEDTPIDLKPVIGEAVDLVSATASAKKLELAFEFQNDFETSLIGDPLRIRQVTLNLLNNAVKFTNTGRVDCIVSGEDRPCGETIVKIIVRDTGVGIPDHMQAAVFEEFVQADVSSTRQFGGTGLGLAICKRLTEAMGGTIRLKSRVGVGTEVAFTLPLKRHIRSEMLLVPSEAELQYA